jgi:hypothetical protein
MRLRRSLRNSAKAGLLLNLALFLCLAAFSGCSTSTSPSFSREEIPSAIRNILKKEYKTDSTTRLVGNTIWIYLPVEDFVIPAKKPEKFMQKFAVEENEGGITDKKISIKYKVSVVPDEELEQPNEYNKKVLETLQNALKALHRVLLSVERNQKNLPTISCIVLADIKNGFRFSEVNYLLDLKKYYYGFISSEEYNHRTVTQLNKTEEVIGDKEGKHLAYKDISFEDFLVGQILTRVRLKFQKPEVEKGVDIDKEILKTAIRTIKIYGFNDFKALNLYNSLTKNNIDLNRQAVETSAIE